MLGAAALFDAGALAAEPLREALVDSGAATSSAARGAQPLTMRELVRRVGKASPGLGLLAAEVAQAEAELEAAGIWDNPSLSYDREETFAAGQGYPENSLRLEVPIELSGRRALEARAAELGLDAARESSAHGRDALVLDAIELFLKAAAVRLELGVLESDRASMAALLDALRARQSDGDASGFDLERLEIEVETTADLVEASRLELERHRRALGWLVGTPAARYDAADGLALPRRPADTATDMAGGAEPTGGVGLATAGRRDVRAAALRVAQAEQALAAAERGWVPALTLSGGLKTATAGTATAWGYGAGISLSLPIIDHGQGDEALARARLARASAERSVLEQGSRARFDAARDSLERAIAQAERFERQQRPRIERMVERAALSYAEGEQKLFELLDAHRTARAARLRAIELRLGARLLELEMWRAQGRQPEVGP